MKKIAILGGGLGAITAAFWLTQKPGWEQEYELTIYQLGWRLGGKGASGRDMRDGFGRRIMEHGLHIWLGFYDNAFITLRAAIDALSEMSPPPVSTFTSLEQAFTPQSVVTLEQRYQDRWAPWPLLFPPNLDQPGKAEDSLLGDLVVEALGWLKDWHDEFYGESSPISASKHSEHPVYSELAELDREVTGTPPAPEGHSLVSWSHALLDRLIQDAEGDLEKGGGVIARALIYAADVVRDAVSDSLPDRRFFVVLDLGLSVIAGILQDQLLSKGFESADGDDFKEWIAKHGAEPVTVSSAPVEVIYDLVFGFDDGDDQRYDFAAGTCARGLLRMLFGYRGNLMFKMNAGMGDTIFTPLWGVLKARGVRFEMFRRVTGLELDASEPSAIGSIRLAHQATVKPEVEATGGYWPFVSVQGIDCWPDRPSFEQLVEGEKLREDPENPGHPYNLESYWTSWPDVGESVLERGKHFDHVLLGISIGALGELCQPLIGQSKAWQAMVEGVRTTPTQSSQLWLTETSEQLGWVIPEWVEKAAADWKQQTGRELGISGLVGAYQDPFNTWADMSHLLPKEDWTEPRSIGYLVGPLKAPTAWPPKSDHEFPRRMHAQVEGGPQLDLGELRDAASQGRVGLRPHGAGSALPGRPASAERCCSFRGPILPRQHRPDGALRAQREGQHQAPHSRRQVRIFEPDAGRRLDLQPRAECRLRGGHRRERDGSRAGHLGLSRAHRG